MEIGSQQKLTDSSERVDTSQYLYFVILSLPEAQKEKWKMEYWCNTEIYASYHSKPRYMYRLGEYTLYPQYDIATREV